MTKTRGNPQAEQLKSMRTTRWLAIVSSGLFLSGVAFIMAGARLSQRRPPAGMTEATIVPVASIRQIMNGIVGPAAERIFDSVQFITTARGMEEKAPHTDAEWEAVGNDAAALIESANLLLMPGRAIDNADWVKLSQAMIQAGKVVLQAAEEKSRDKVFNSGDALNATCDNCHQRYQRSF